MAQVDYLQLVMGLFLGLFSHIVLDSFTPSGIKIFAPISQKKVYKNFGLSMIFLLLAGAIIINVPMLYNLFENYALSII
jgi:inner membrane protein